MTEWIWLNGNVMPLAEARVGVEDRGFQFADGVYEVVRVYDGVPFTLDRHLARLSRSAEGIRVGIPLPMPDLELAIRDLAARSALTDGMVYLQLTRGAARRNHAFPETRPTLLFYCRELPPLPPIERVEGVKLLPVADGRWDRCWIKSIALLPNVLAKNQALDAGFDEAVFVDGDRITECSASNVFAVIDGRLVTHPAGGKVLGGITREVILELCGKLEIAIEERPWTEAEALAAPEVFITSTTRELAWVSHWNDRPIASGPGPVTLNIHRAFRQRYGK